VWAQLAWLAWGLAWFVLASAALTPIYPLWQPNRSQIGSVGLGVALATGIGATHPALAASVAGARLVMLLLAPTSARTTSGEPPETGAFMDFAKLTRLQHFMRETRQTLHARYPTLPHGGTVLLVNMPHLLLYAFGGDEAVQAWYADSTLHLKSFDVFHKNREMPVAAVLQYQPHEALELIAVSPAAIKAQEDAFAELQLEHYPQAFALLARAD